MGPTEIPALATSVRQAFDLAKGTKAPIDALNDAEAKFKMAEPYSALADAKVVIADAVDAVAAKDKEIERLKAAFRRRDETIELRGFRYRIGAHGNPIGLPFCPRCLEKDGFPILLQRSTVAGRALQCPECKQPYHNRPGICHL
jgi:hypothetical protein